MLAGAGTALAFLVLIAFVYGRLNPPLHDHAHCMKVAIGMLDQYAVEHDGRYPYHTNGYGDALLLLTTNRREFEFLTAHGYSPEVFVNALKNGADVPESKVGRVYIQGLTMSNSGNIVLFFDKKSRRGGREVADVEGIVKDSDWPEFVAKQIELLVNAGIPRKVAQSYYAEEP